MTVANLDVSANPTVLGRLIGANFNSTSDQAIPIRPGASRYQVKAFVITNASHALNTADGNFYAAASKTTPLGEEMFGLAGAISGIAVASDLAELSPGNNSTLKARTESTLYLSLSVAQGVACTADVYVIGNILPTT